MAKAIRGHNLGTALAMVLLVALLLLIASVFVVWQATTTGDRSGTPAILTSSATPRWSPVSAPTHPR